MSKVRNIVKEVEILDILVDDEDTIELVLGNGDTLKISDGEHVGLGKTELHASQEYISETGKIYEPISKDGILFFEEIKWK